METNDSSDDEDDRKPAAVPNHHPADKDAADDDASSSSSEEEEEATNDTNQNDKDNNSTAKQPVDEHGRELSRYELLRLERIQRNRDYLSQLGLDNASLHSMRQKPKKKKKPIVKPPSQPQRSSGRVRKSVSYKEPSNSVAALLRKTNNKESSTAKTTKKPPPPATNDTPAKKRTPKVVRMERFLFREFQRIKSLKTQTLKQAQRLVKAADKQVVYWKRQVAKDEIKKAKQGEKQRKQQLQQAALQDFGGKTLKQLGREIDQKMPTLVAALQRYDQEYEAAGQARERQAQQLDRLEQMKLLGALDLFPKALQSSTTLLNTVLVRRSPDDPPRKRRSSRFVEPAIEVIETTTTPDQRIEMDKFYENAEDPGSFVSEPVLRSSPLFSRLEARVKSTEQAVRNVGGWISPQFSAMIDRSWLDTDRPVHDFHPSTFVPQVGDVVLYYPTGHQVYLENYPDILGEKTGDPSRIPLWERAFAEKENKSSAADEGDRSPGGWWNDRWLEGIEENLGAYPIICRVQSTHAEFPPDPFTKIPKTDDEGNVVKITWKAPKDPGAVRRAAGTPLRLAVELCPLTPVLPPKWTRNGPRNESNLALPPCFTAVTFPTKLKPFLVPLVWAYGASHSFSIDEKVSSILNTGLGKVQVRLFSTLDETSGSMRLDDKLPFIHTLTNRWKDPRTTRRCLEEDISQQTEALPLRDARAITSILKAYLQHSDSSETEEGPLVNILDLVRSTLPLWESASAMPSAYNRAKHFFTPWELVPHRKERRNLLPFKPFTMDDGLRNMMDFSIEDMLNTDASAGLFEQPVDGEEAPSYDCAVPRSMTLGRILSRLKKSKESNPRCYYRGVEALLADIEGIVGNCLLYNSPLSPIVEAAVRVVKRLKETLHTNALSRYFDLGATRKFDEEREERMLPIEPCGSESVDVYSKITTIKAPHRNEVYRDWLLPPPPNAGKFDTTEWVPQVGDTVFYSIKRHEKFIEYHQASLRDEQLGHLEASADTRNDRSCGDDDWVQSLVLSVEPCYPKSCGKGHSQNTATFPTNSLVLSIRLEIVPTKKVGQLWWRPCLFHAESPGESNSICQCGLSLDESFLKPDNGSPSTVEYLEAPANADTCAGQPIGMIEPLLGFIKRKCLQEGPVAYIDPELTEKSVKRGYRPSQIRGRLRNLPTYDHLISREPFQDDHSVAVTTRGVPRKSLIEDTGRDRLSDSGFLPLWCKGAIARADVDLNKSAMVVPIPECSLELVCCLIRNGHYRTSAAVESDILESFITTVSLILKDVARKKLSMKRISKSVAGHVSNTDSDLPSCIADEETRIAQQLGRVRDLHAIAMTATSFAGQLGCMFGLTNRSEKLSLVLNAPDPVQEPKRAEARARLSELLSAVGRDKSHKTKAIIPTIKVRIKVDGEDISCTKQVTIIDHCIAEMNEKEVKVKLTSDGQVIPFYKEIDPSDDNTSKQTKKKRKRLVQTCIPIEQSDFEGSDLLSQFCFARPGSKQPCARCTVHKRSFLVCRVKRGHTNSDFDWVSTFRGVGGVDGLLDALFPNSSGLDNVQGTAEPVTNESAHGESSKGQADEEEDMVDPRDFVTRAQKSLLEANKLMHDAAKYAEAPARLDKEFLDSSMPIDQSDGHFVYCVICGLSGNLLCCDGCANVVHSDCVGLAEIPEDKEWFCEECEMHGKQNEWKGKPPEVASEETETGSGVPGSEKDNGCDAKPSLPFGRLLFDHAKAQEVATSIEQLKRSRPTPKKRAKGDDEEEDSDADDDEEGESDADEDAEVEPSDDEASIDTTSIRSTRLRRRAALKKEVVSSNCSENEKKSPSRRRSTTASKPLDRRRKKRSAKQEVINRDDNEENEKPLKRLRGRPRKVTKTKNGETENYPVAEQRRGARIRGSLRGRPRTVTKTKNGETENYPVAEQRRGARIRGSLRGRPRTVSKTKNSETENYPVAEPRRGARIRGSLRGRPRTVSKTKDSETENYPVAEPRRGARKRDNSNDDVEDPPQTSARTYKTKRGRSRDNKSTSANMRTQAHNGHISRKPSADIEAAPRFSRSRKAPVRYQEASLPTGRAPVDTPTQERHSFISRKRANSPNRTTEPPFKRKRRSRRARSFVKDFFEEPMR